MSDTRIGSTIRDGIAELALQREAARNALDRALLQALADAVAAADVDPGISVILLHGAGKHFCAGTDVTAPWPSDLTGLILDGIGPRETLSTARKPVVVAVEGAAYGGGFELALSADIVIASNSAKFALPEYGFGSLPASGALSRLAWRCGPAVTADLLYSSRPVDAQEALRLGIVSRVVGEGAALEAAREVCGKIAAGGPTLAMLAKQALSASAPRPSAAHETLLGFAAFAAMHAKAES